MVLNSMADCKVLLYHFKSKQLKVSSCLTIIQVVAGMLSNCFLLSWYIGYELKFLLLTQLLQSIKSQLEQATSQILGFT